MSTGKIADDETESKGKDKKKKECSNINYIFYPLLSFL